MDINVVFKQIIVPIIAIIFVFLFPHIGIMPVFTYTFIVLLFIWLYLKKSGENFENIGFNFKALSWRAALIGTITGICLFCFLQFLFFPLLSMVIPLKKADLKDFAGIRHNTAAYLFVLLMGWIVGGLYEEIVFHGFIFTRIEKIFPGKKATPMAVLLTALIFGIYHIQLGTSGVLNALIAGAGYHLLMLKYKRNIWYAFFAHGIFDTIALTFIYIGYW